MERFEQARRMLTSPHRYESMYRDMGRRSASMESLASIQELCKKEREKTKEEINSSIQAIDDLDGYKGIRMKLKDVVNQFQNPLNEEDEVLSKKRDKRTIIVSTTTDPYALSKKTHEENKGIAQKVTGAIKKVMKKDEESPVIKEQKELMKRMDGEIRSRDDDLHKAGLLNQEMTRAINVVSRKLRDCLREKEELEKKNDELSKRQRPITPSGLDPSAPAFEKIISETVSDITWKEEPPNPSQGNVRWIRAPASSKEGQAEKRNEKQGTEAPSPFHDDKGNEQGTRAPASSQDDQEYETQETSAPALSHEGRNTRNSPNQMEDERQWNLLWPSYRPNNSEYNPKFDREKLEERIAVMRDDLSYPYLYDIDPEDWMTRLQTYPMNETGDQLYLAGLHHSVMLGKYMDALEIIDDSKEKISRLTADILSLEGLRDKENEWKRSWNDKEERWKQAWNDREDEMEKYRNEAIVANTALKNKIKTLKNSIKI